LLKFFYWPDEYTQAYFAKVSPSVLGDANKINRHSYSCQLLFMVVGNNIQLTSPNPLAASFVVNKR
jgi:hypothetical protein